MTTYDMAEELKDDLYQDKITYDEFEKRLKKVQALCKHERKDVHVDDYDYYVNCKDCGEDL